MQLSTFSNPRMQWCFQPLALLLACVSALCLGLFGCGGGGISAVGITPVLSTVYTPGQTIYVDGGQQLSINASLINDATGAGATISLSGPGSIVTSGPSPVASSKQYSVVYTAPPNPSAGSTATVTITSNSSPVQTASLTITLEPALTITTSSIPAGIAGVAYSTTLTATGGTPTLSWKLASGTLPTGISLSTTGVLSGTTTVAGTFNITVALTDGSSTSPNVTQAYTLVIAPVVTTSTLPNGVVGTPYSAQLAYVGGTTGTFAITSGSLPAGLSLSASGAITGTPASSTAGTTSAFNVTVTVNGAASSASALSITIAPPPVITTTALPSGNVGIPYSQTLSYTGGGGGTVSWAITSGSLPSSSGLALNTTTGVISGTPTTATTYTFSVAVTVGTQTSAPQAYTLVINSLVITSGATASGEVGLPFSFQLKAAGGTGPYTWSLLSGTYPAAGFSMSTGGLITGTPTTAGTYSNIVVQAKDSLGATATQSMAFTISPAESTVNNSVLNGQYAFLLNGFDATGHPLAMVGEFTADGAGHITTGLLDQNGTGYTLPVLNTALTTGTSFSIGADNRGRVKITTTSGSYTFVVALSTLASGVAQSGYMTEFDTSGLSLSGTLALQTPSAFTTASLTGGYAYGLEGFASGSAAGSLARRGMIGESQFNGAGSATSGEFLATSLGTTTPATPTATALTITPTGRGTLSYTYSSNGTKTANFVVYVVNATKLFVLSSDAANTGGKDLLSGTAVAQTIANGNFAAGSLSGVSVTRLERLTVNSSNATVPDVQLGLFTFNGTGRLSLATDEDAGGAVSSNTSAGTYTVSATGRVQMALTTGLGGCADCIAPLTFAYLFGQNQGFVLDFTGAPNTGFFDNQTASGFSAASLSGTASDGVIVPLSQIAGYSTTAFTSNGAGSITGTADIAVTTTLTPDVPLSATYTVGSTGRVAIATTGNGQVLYLITPTRGWLLDLTTLNPVIQEVQHQ